MTTIYSITSDGGSSYFPTLREAQEATGNYENEWFELERLVIVDLPPRRLACRLLNAESFVVERETIAEQTGGVCWGPPQEEVEKTQGRPIEIAK